MTDDPFPSHSEEANGPPTGRVRIVGAETAGRLAGTGEVPSVPRDPGAPGGQHPEAVTDSDVWSLGAETEAEEGAVAGATEASTEGAEPELPHWTEAPTGQVPAILKRTVDGSSDDDDPWSTLPAPTWREQHTDWEAHEESFDPSVLAHDESRLGSLDDSGGSDRQPWAFDLPEAGAKSDDGGVENGEGSSFPLGSAGDEETVMIPAVGLRSEGSLTIEGSLTLEGSPTPEGALTFEGSPTPEGALTGEILFRFDERVGASDRDVSIPLGDEAAGATALHREGDGRGKGIDDRGEKIASPVDEPLFALADTAVDLEEERGEGPEKLENGPHQRAHVAERGPLRSPRRTEADGAPRGTEASVAGTSGASLLGAQKPDGEAERTPRGSATDRPQVERSGTRQPQRPGRPRTPRPRPTPDHEEERSGRNVPLAIASGLIIGVLALVFFKLGNLPSVIIVTVIVTLAAMEAFGAFRKANYHPATFLGLVATVALMVATYSRGQQALLLVLALLVVFTMLWHLAGVDRRADPVLSTGSTLLVFCWIALFGSFGALLLNPAVFPDRHGIAFLVAAVVVGVAYDVGAWATGVWIGRRPMAPRVSPRKTWEGFIGGAVAAILVAVVVVHLIHPWTYGAAAALGIMAAIVSPIGDLSESLMKRHLGIKDMGRIMPGHGGVLDRVDGLLFLMPATYYLVRALHLG